MTKDDDRLRDLEVKMATLTADVENQESRLNNHADRISDVEKQTQEDRMRTARIETSIEATSSLKRWVVGTLCTVLGLGLTLTLVLFKVLEAMQKGKS